MKPIIYLYFHSKILELKGREFKDKDFFAYLAQWRIPKDLRYPIMNEMAEMGLLKIEKRMVYLQDFYFDKRLRIKADFSDPDTRVINPYVSYNDLK